MNETAEDPWKTNPDYIKARKDMGALLDAHEKEYGVVYTLDDINTGKVNFWDLEQVQIEMAVARSILEKLK